jgi:uncharacterized protein YcbK (DUF882 family)
MRLIMMAGVAMGAVLLQTPTASPAAAKGENCLPPAVRASLAQVRRQFGGATVISTYRKGARIRGSGKPSYHASCRAADFVAAQGNHRNVVRWLYANHNGGVGTYSRMGHIHIDNGPYVRWHH